MISSKNISIIGGGAAGFFAALAASENNPKARITIFEAGRRTLEKVAISGGGRCNVTNSCFEIKEFVKAYPRGAKELLSPFSRFQAKDTVAWFRNHGVTLKAEADGRMFPTTNDSATVVNCLTKAADEQGVSVSTKCKVTGIKQVAGRFQLEVTGSKDFTFESDKVVITTGGTRGGFSLAKSLGHTIIEPVPSLFTFEIKDKELTQLSGVSIENAEITLSFPTAKSFYECGPLLITHWGLSGPAVLRLSAWAARELFASNYKAEIAINWISKKRDQAVKDLLVVKEETPRQTVSGSSNFLLPWRLWQLLVRAAGVSESAKWAEISKAALEQLADRLTNFKLKVMGKGVFKEEFVTCGGIKLSEVDFRTMQSKICSGLYFAGEVLDIDAITGGYNFQAAWTTGWIAGKSCIDE